MHWTWDPDPQNHKTGFDSVDDIADWFRNDDEMRRDSLLRIKENFTLILFLTLNKN
jgi:hypothetical protein